jgi:hypothetical protein
MTAAIMLLSLPGSAQDGWTNLFNGKDLTGWFETTGINGDHVWTAKDGMIIGTSVPGQANGFLLHEKEYGDFVLELEVSVDTLMNNSGIQVRSLTYPEYNNWRLHGYQVEIEPLTLHRSGAIYDEGTMRGWLTTARELSPAAQNAFKRDTRKGYQWNKYRIEAVGNMIRTWVNGIPTAHLIDDKALRGYVGFQMHANNAQDPQGVFSIRFRNIRIQTGDLKLLPLDDALVVNLVPNHVSAQEERNGYTLLWDGRSSKGWKGPNKSEFPKSSWSIANGELSTLKPEGSERGDYLVSEKAYGPFELKFDFKFSAGSNSGVKYFVNEGDGSREAALSSLEFQIVDDATPDLAANRKLGALADIKERPAPPSTAGAPNGTVPPRPARVDQWHRAMIIARPDNHVEYWLNGFKILEYERGSKEFKELVAKSKYKDLPNFGMSPTGHILLENNGTGVSFRSIKIKPY